MNENNGLKTGSLKFIAVFAIAAGAIFTFIGYWDTVFVSYCGPATWLAFAAMTIAVLPIAFVYCELAPMFPQTGAELAYATEGFNKQVGFFSSWSILMAYIAVPPAAVMAIIQWFVYKVFPQFGFTPDPSFATIVVVGLVILIIYFILSMVNIEIAGKIQTGMLVFAIAGCLITTFILIFGSGQWSFANFVEGTTKSGFFRSTTIGGDGFFGWFIGLALIITPYFGFETVPLLTEEANFGPKQTTRAIWGSVVVCGVIYTLLFFAIGGLDKWENLLFIGGDATAGEYDFLTITAMQRLSAGVGVWDGWNIWILIFGIATIICAIGTCLLGFWVSAVRMYYAMGRANYLPKAFEKCNKYGQPIWPNILILAISILFLVLQNSGSFMKDFFNLMSFACGITYTIITVADMRIVKKHPEWTAHYKIPGGQAMRIIACIISVVICIGTAIGQSWGSWVDFFIYIGIGVVFMIWMHIRWKNGKQERPKWITPDGEKEY